MDEVKCFNTAKVSAGLCGCETRVMRKRFLKKNSSFCNEVPEIYWDDDVIRQRGKVSRKRNIKYP